MKMFLYSVEGADGQPRKMFPTCDEAKAERLSHEYIVEYTFSLEDSEPIVYPELLVLEGGTEE